MDAEEKDSGGKRERECDKGVRKGDEGTTPPTHHHRSAIFRFDRKI